MHMTFMNFNICGKIYCLHKKYYSRSGLLLDYLEDKNGETDPNNNIYIDIKNPSSFDKVLDYLSNEDARRENHPDEKELKFWQIDVKKTIKKYPDMYLEALHNKTNLNNMNNFFVREIGFRKRDVLNDALISEKDLLSKPHDVNYSTKNNFNEQFHLEYIHDHNCLINNKYFNWNNVILAGGSVVCRILGTPVKDYDIFIHGLSTEKTFEKIKYVCNFIKDYYQKFHADKCSSFVMMRNYNCINIYVEYETIRLDGKKAKKRIQYQIILTSFTDIQQILNGFDIDCCCIAYDGKNLLATNRGYLAYATGINFVNLMFLSKSYNFRLDKYMHRSFSVYIPYFKRTKVPKKSDIYGYYGLGNLLRLEKTENRPKNEFFTEKEKYQSFTTYYLNKSIKSDSKELKNDIVLVQKMLDSQGTINILPEIKPEIVMEYTNKNTKEKTTKKGFGCYFTDNVDMLLSIPEEYYNSELFLLAKNANTHLKKNTVFRKINISEPDWYNKIFSVKELIEDDSKPMILIDEP